MKRQKQDGSDRVDRRLGDGPLQGDVLGVGGIADESTRESEARDKGGGGRRDGDGIQGKTEVTKNTNSRHWTVAR